MLASARMCCDDDDDPGGKNVANPDRMDRAAMIFFCSACVSVCNEYMHFFVLFVLLAFCALVLLSLSRDFFG